MSGWSTSSSWGDFSSPSKKKKDSNSSSSSGWGTSGWGSSDSSKKNSDSSTSGWGWGSSSSSSSTKEEMFFRKGDLFKKIPSESKQQFLKFEEHTNQVKIEAKATRDTLNKIEGLPPISNAVANYQQMMTTLLDRLDQYRRELAPFYDEIKQQFSLANEIQSDLARRSYGGSGTARGMDSSSRGSGSGISSGMNSGGISSGGIGGWLIGDPSGMRVSSGMDLPPPYYWKLVGGFEERIAAMRKCVEQLTDEMRDLEQTSGLSSSMMSMDISMDDHNNHTVRSSRKRTDLDVLVSSLQSVFRATVNLARQVSSLHSETESLKAAYSDYRRVRFGDMADHFAATRIRCQAVAKARRNSLVHGSAGSSSVSVSSLLDQGPPTLGPMAGLPGYDALTEYEATQAQTLKLSGLQAVDVRVDPQLAGQVTGNAAQGSSDDQKKDDASGSGSSSGASGSSSSWGDWGKSSSGSSSSSLSDSKDTGFTFGTSSSSSSDSSKSSGFASSSFSW